jgi:hypothetical protein
MMIDCSLAPLWGIVAMENIHAATTAHQGQGLQTKFIFVCGE